jgi:3-phenylpropionate/cinnamic acid dioxygenase small subunit
MPPAAGMYHLAPIYKEEGELMATSKLVATTCILLGGAALLVGGYSLGSARAGAPVAADTQAQDRLAIEETLRRYVVALDASDMDAYLATLADDAKFVSAEATYEGREAIRKYVEPVMQSRLKRREKEGAAATATHHVVTNQSIEFTGADNAVVRSYWMFVVAHGEKQPMTVDLMGSSEDYMSRRNGKWLLKERRVAP